MTLEKFNELQKSIKKGCYYKIDFMSVKELKGNTIEKHSSGVYRLGISYKNIGKVKDIGTHSLPYGEWETLNFLIKHKESFQLRLYSSNCKNHKTKSFYKLNGKEITKQELIACSNSAPSRYPLTNLPATCSNICAQKQRAADSSITRFQTSADRGVIPATTAVIGVSNPI